MCDPNTLKYSGFIYEVYSKKCVVFKAKGKRRIGINAWVGGAGAGAGTGTDPE